MCEWCVCSKIESGVARFHMRRPGCQHCCCHTGVPTMYYPVRRSLNAKLMAMFFFSSFFQPLFQQSLKCIATHGHGTHHTCTKITAAAAPRDGVPIGGAATDTTTHSRLNRSDKITAPFRCCRKGSGRQIGQRFLHRCAVRLLPSK